MVAKIQGVFIETDIPTKELILNINNSKSDSRQKFVIQELDDCRLLIDASYLDQLKDEIKDFHRKITYTKPQDGGVGVEKMTAPASKRGRKGGGG